MSPNEQSTGQEAFSKVPPFIGAERAGTVTVSSSGATGSELETVKRALENPPARRDWAAVILSLASAVVVASKILKDAIGKDELFTLGAFELLVLLAVVVPPIVTSVRLAVAWKPDPLNEQALDYVNRLIAVQQRSKQESTVQDASESRE